jgi:mitochondrial fission protein ELM1
MKKSKALLLTEGMHGMISQVEGMAKALNTEFSHKTIRLSFPWNFLPAKITPASQIILKNKIYLSEDDSPDIVISCGRKSVAPSIFLKKKNPKIFTIHIQDPKVSLKNFDIIIAPEHDNLDGINVISSKGAIHYITEEEVNNSKSYLENKIKSQKIVSIVLGGPNKYYDFNENQLKNIFTKIRSEFINNGYKVIVIPSMRTPKLIINLAAKEFEEDGYVVKNVDKKAYLSALALANYIVVTSDSTSMISEAATSGKPIFIAHMKAKKNNYRFKKFYKLFKELGIIRDLGEKVENWKYETLNEAEKIAVKIKNKLKN